MTRQAYIYRTQALFIQRLYICLIIAKYFDVLNRLTRAQSASDHLGSSSIITDSAGNKVQETYYYPFGGTRLNTGSVNVKHKYTGQEEDPETGLYFYNARYYDPQLGRFISADSIVGNPRDPQELNRYTYAGNNPLIYTDPSGHLKFKSIWRAVASIAVGAVITAVTGGLGAPSLIAAISGGASMGATSAALNGGNIGKGALTGAITGALFYGAGDIIQGAKDITSIGKAAIHMTAGAISGGINSSLTGGDVGMGLLVGGLAGGFANYAGSFLPDDFGYQLAGSSLIGGVTGGFAASLYGGKFEDGFALGGITGAAGFLFNHWYHRNGRPVYHRHGNNPPHWSGPSGKGAVTMEIPLDGSSIAFNQAMAETAEYYFEALSLAVGYATYTVTGKIHYGIRVKEGIETAYKYFLGEPTGTAVELINPRNAE